MTRQPLTKAEREELRRLNDAASPAPWFVFKMDGYPNVVSYTVPHNGETLRGEIPADDADDELIAAARNALPRLLADLDAAEAERDALRKIAEGCCNATDGGCSPGVSIEFLRDVPSEVEHIKRERDRLRKMPQSAFEAATFRELNAMEAQRDRAESELDAERRMRVEAEAASDRLMAERDALKAKLAALVDFNVAELGRTRKEVWPDCELCRDSTHDHECAGPEPNPRWGELSAAIAAARGGAF